VQPGLTRGMKPFDTCCKRCSTTKGTGGHDDNCGGTLPARVTVSPSLSEALENPKEWIRGLLDAEGSRLQRHAERIFACACSGSDGDRLKTEDVWPALDSKLLEPVGGKLNLSEAERADVVKGLVHHRRSWFHHHKSEKKEGDDIDFETFKEICKSALTKMYQHWFPLKLPTKTQHFVRKNPLKVDEVYTFGAQLGEGSFGIVHSVTHKVSGEQRVCKRICKQKGREGMKVEEILQEIDSMAMLDHPNIIKVYEYFEDRDSIFQIMEPCRGGELQHTIDAVFRKKKQPMYSEAFMCDVTKQTLRALAFIHGERFLHKDLKPQNIMLADKAEPGDNTATIKVIDFGLAELFSKDQKVSNQFGGTLLYMAPEVFRLELTMKSDIWSLGVILYNLVTGDYPFMATWPLPPGKDMDWWQSEVSRVIQDPEISFKPNKKLTDGTITKECFDLLQLMMTKDPQKRPLAEECLEHAWFKKFDQHLPPLSVGVTQCLEAYSVMPELKKSFFLLIAHQSTAPAQAAALQELRAIFTHFDVRNRGALSEDNLREVLQKSGMSPIKTERIVYALDRDDSGLVSWTEFSAAALCISVCHSERLLSAAFHVFDTDMDHKVYDKDLLAVFSKGSLGVWKDHLADEAASLSDRPRAGYTMEHFTKYMGSYIATSGGDQLRAVG